MVGLVLVSHSETLARGVLELLRPMAPDAPVAIAAGIDDPEHPIGTDAARILEAIRSVRCGDGVLLLMDLGSALLSADMAMELLAADPAGGPVARCAAPLVEGAVAAAVRAQAGGTLVEVLREAEDALEAKREHVGAAGPAGPAAPAAPPAPGAAPPEAARPEASRRVRLPNPLGLHARPAARLVRAAAKFDARITVANTTRGRGPASALSLTRLAALDLRQGDEMAIGASGLQAGQAVSAIAAMAEAGFGEMAAVEPAAAQQLPKAPAARPQLSRFTGSGVSPGLALGRAAVARPASRSAAGSGDPRQELARLTAALAAVGRRLEQAADRLEPQVGAERAEMLRAEAVMVADPDLLQAARTAILGGAASAEAAWEQALGGAIEACRRLESAYMRDRVWDVVDIRSQVLDELGGAAGRPAASAERAVLVLPELLLSGLAELEDARPLAIVAARGGATSHAAIFARAITVPCVIGVGDAILDLPQGTLLAVDGAAGEARVIPQQERAAWEALRVRRSTLEAELIARAAEPAVSLDGARIAVTANIASLEEARQAAKVHADGVGVFRTAEFAGPAKPPDEDAQARIYSSAASLLAGRPVVVRTLDVGGDKPIGGMAARGEANPFLGVRGCRLYRRIPEVFRAQLRAALRAGAAGRIELMFPMVANAEEARELRAAVEEERAALGAAAVRVGLMIEIPSAAIAADSLAPHADFFSIGTNDLSQYLFAADRTNPDVAPLADALHPALLRAIAAATRAGRAAGVPSTVCGEVAARPVAVPLLVGLGVVELSVAPGSVPLVKEAVRRIDLSLAARVAEEALLLDSSAAVEQLVLTRFPRLAELEPRAATAG